MNALPIVVFDFETGGLDTATLEPIQIAAVAIDPRSLRIIPGSKFESLMRPIDMNNLDQRALDVNGKTREQLKVAPEQEGVWRRFAEYCWSHNTKGKSPFGAPIPAGKNIRNFDIPILQRLCSTYKMVDKKGEQTLFNRRTIIDLEDQLFMWFEGSNELPNFKMDTWREYTDMPTAGAHDALVDVLQTAESILRFMKLCRSLRAMKKKDGTPYIPIKGSFKDWKAPVV